MDHEELDWAHRARGARNGTTRLTGATPPKGEDVAPETPGVSSAPVTGVAGLLAGVVAGTSVAVEAYDGSRAGTTLPDVTVVIRSADALRRMLTAPGQLGFARAYTAGDIDVAGDVYTVLQLQERLKSEGLTAHRLVTLLRLLREGGGVGRPLPPPPEEARLSGRLHSRRRDATAVSHHYDVSNDFYELFLGPSMTYSCAVWSSPPVGLDAAQEAKYELVSRKLGLRPGTRLLDVGCGWGGMMMHAVRHHGVTAGGLRPQARPRRRPAGPHHHPAAGLPRHRRRTLRRNQLDRHVRARG
jgi:cyclopropane-fatty-acyl-phospholipid synthase